MCDNCEWEEYLEEIGAMLVEEEYEFAEDTLQGIYNWVNNNQHITDRQKEAVKNIIDSV